MIGFVSGYIYIYNIYIHIHCIYSRGPLMVSFLHDPNHMYLRGRTLGA